MPEPKDPVVLLVEARRRYFVRAILSLACIAALLGIDLSQESKLEQQERLLLANEHAIVDLTKSSKALQAVCSPLITRPEFPPDGCHKDGDLLVCEELHKDEPLR